MGISGRYYDEKNDLQDIILYVEIFLKSGITNGRKQA